MDELTLHDLAYCVQRLPSCIRDLLKAHRELFLAGGFVRSVVLGERVSDIDLFTDTKDHAVAFAGELEHICARTIETDNAITVRLKTNPIPVQFIHRWRFNTPVECLESFDFTIARAAIWWSGGGWASSCDPRFYADLAAKRLVYCSPQRNEDAGGSMLRVLKFYQRGYRIPLDSLGAVMARMFSAVDCTQHGAGASRELALAQILTGLLREVDPQTDPDHIYHLPSLSEAGIQVAGEAPDAS